MLVFKCSQFTGELVVKCIKIPVIANGDIKNAEDAKKALELSGADGVMIGRACYGKPWLINQISHQLVGRDDFVIPNIIEQKLIVLNHFDEMIEHYGEQVAIPLARKHIGWYSSGLRNGAEFRAKVNTMKEAVEIKDHINTFYESQICPN
jgi:tRNA-dihydrouridine synthase B